MGASYVRHFATGTDGDVCVNCYRRVYSVETVVYTVLMLIFIHIIIALVSTALSTITALRPSQRFITANYSLIGMTVASGTVLIVTQSSNVLKSCLVGLIYIAVVLGLSVVAHRRSKLISATDKNEG